MNKQIILVILSLVLINCVFNRNLQNTASEPTTKAQTEEQTKPPQPTTDPGITEIDAQVDSSITKCPPADQMPYIKLACIQTPVCGYLDPSKCNEKNCKVQFNSNCEACTYGGILYYELKKCDDDSNQYIDPVPSIMPIALEYLKCTEEERNTPCYDTPTNNKVCAINNQCMDDTSRCKTFDNLCTVCKDPGTIYYFLSDCSSSVQYNPLPIIEQPEDMFSIRIFCDNGYRNADCGDMKNETPQVCGFKKDCNPLVEQCFATYNNKCDVCQNENITEFTNIPCPEAIKCKDATFESDCENNFKLVCGYKANCKEGDNCYNDYPACEVCKNTEVESFFNHDCNTLSVLYRPYEEINNFYATYVCTDLGKKVCERENNMGNFCAHKNKESCTTDDCSKNFENLCDACNDKEYEWVENVSCYSEGEIAIDYLYDNEIPSLPEIKYTTTNVNNDKAQDTNKSTDNAAAGVNQSVLAEASLDVNVSISMQAKRCNSSSGNICPEIYSPVCAYKKCSSGLCPAEKPNSCFACVDNTVEYYVEEPCNKTISKRIDVSCMEKEKVAQCSENSVMMRNVCGISSCEDGICHKNFATVCDACSEIKVNQYYEGECFGNFFNISLILLVLISLVLI